MFDKVLKTIEKFNMILDNSAVVIGVSGGADSVCLLHIMNRISHIYNFKIVVVHVNHCLRGKDADSDEIYVKNLCESMGVEFRRFSTDIKKMAQKLSISEEEAGRIFRYQCFDKVSNEFLKSKIAVAHNKNDNAETLIMRFIRGTGIKGLCGIPPVRNNIIRPLIECERSEIEKYCFDNNLKFCTDATNFVNIYTRNKIRLELLPWIAENMNKNIISTLVKNSSVISEEENFLEEVSSDAFKECAVNSDFSSEVFLDCKKLLSFHDVIKRRVIRKACRFFSNDLHDISFQHINSVISLAEKETGKLITLPSEICVEKVYNNIKFYKYVHNSFFCSKELLSFNYTLMYNKRIRINELGYDFILSQLPYLNFSKDKPFITITLDKSKVNGNISVRNRLNGDKIFVVGVGNKKLKNVFSENKILENQRKNFPVLADEKNVISLVGLRVSDLYKPTNNSNEKIYIYVWRTDAL